MTDLFDAIDALTLPRTTGVMQGDRLVKITHDPLLVQLEAAITSATTGNGGGSGSPTGVLVNSGALHKAHVITSQIRDWCRLVGVVPKRDAVGNLRAWGVTAMAAIDTTWHVQQMRQWVREINQLLDPWDVVPFAGACPVCKAVRWESEEGLVSPDPVAARFDPARPFLTVKAVCRVAECSAEWEGAEAIAELIEEMKAGDLRTA